MQQKRSSLHVILALIMSFVIVLQQIIPVMAQDEAPPPNHQLFLPLVSASGNDAIVERALLADGGAGDGLLRLNPEQKYSYQWQASTTAHGYTRDNQTQKMVADSTNQMQVNATADIIPVEKQADGAMLVQLTVAKPVIAYQTEGGMVANSEDDDFIKALAQPIYFTQQANGQIDAIFYPARESADTINLKRGIISALQTQLQSGTDGTETDVSGSYVAKYQQQRTQRGLLVTKQRTQDSYIAFADQSIQDRAFRLSSQNTSDFDAQLGIIRSATFKDHIVSTDDAASTNELGVTPWSETTVAGSLQLQAISRGRAEPMVEGYVRGTLVATATEEKAPEIGADGGELPLRELLDRLAEAPEDIAGFNSLVNTLRHPDAANELSRLLETQSLHPHILNVVAGALAAEGSAPAQEILVSQMLLNERMPVDVQESALLSLLFVEKPEQRVTEPLAALSNDPTYALQEQATLVLGALAYTIQATAPAGALAIVEQLETRLATARTAVDQTLALRALGNAGHPKAIAQIAPFLDNDSVWLRVAAVDALRKIAGEQADQLIVNRANRDTNVAVRELAATLYRERMHDDLAAAAVTGQFEWSKTKWIGNGDIKGELTFKLKGSDTPDITLSATGEALAHAWSWHYSILKGQLLSEVVTQNGQIKRHSLAELKVLNNSVAKKEHYLVCGEEKSGSVLNSPLTQQFFSLSKSFYPWGIKVTLSVKASGSLDLKYRYKFTACNAPIQAAAEGSLTPEAKLTAQGDAMVSIYIARGGARIVADILKTTLPASLNAQINYGTFQVCANLKLQMQPISGKLSLWYQLRKFTGGWKPEHSWTLWSFSSPTQSLTLIAQCLP